MRATRGVLVHVDACAAAGHVTGRLRARSAPTSARSPGTSSAARRAPRRCSCGAVCGSRRSWSAARRNGPGAAASRTSPAIVGFGAAAEELTGGGHLDDEAAAARGAHRRGIAQSARRESPASSASASPTSALPHLVCLGLDGRRGRADPARARPARRRRALGLVVLERDARTVTGARRDGRRCRPLAAGQRRVVLHRRRRRRVPRRIPRNRRAIQGVANEHDPGHATQPRRALRPRRPGVVRLLPGGVRLRGRRADRPERRCSCGHGSSDNHHDLGLVLGRVRRRRAREQRAGRVSTTSRGRCPRSRRSPTRARTCASSARSSARATTA